LSTFTGVFEGFRARSGEKSFLDRLEDVRGRLIASVVAVVICTGIGFYMSMNYDVLGIFTAPIQPFLNGERIKYLSPVDPFVVTLKLALCIGLILALPYLLRQLWAALSPLMLPSEKRLMAPAVVAGFLLFAIGVVFCYFLVLPLMLRFTMTFQAESLEQSIVIGEYLTVVLRMLIAFGLAFELPIAILIGTVLGLLTPEWLASKRRHALATIIILGAIVTPPDVSSLILLSIPVYALYEMSIVMSRVIVSRRASALAASEL